MIENDGSDDGGGHRETDALRTELGRHWRPAEQRGEAPLAIEEQAYPCDRTSCRGKAPTEMACIDPCSLY